MRGFLFVSLAVLSAASMTHVTPDQVRHIAQLARLRIAEEDLETQAKHLSAILSYVEKLQEVPTSASDEHGQVTGLHTMLRQDVVYSDPLADPDDLLASSPLPIKDHQIQTPSAHG